MVLFGVGSGESADRRLKLGVGSGVLVLGVGSRLRAYHATWRDKRATYHDRENPPAISRPTKPNGGDDQSKLPFEGFIH